MMTILKTNSQLSCNKINLNLIMVKIKIIQKAKLAIQKIKYLKVKTLINRRNRKMYNSN